MRKNFYWGIGFLILCLFACSRVVQNFNLFPIGSDLSFGEKVSNEFEQGNATLIMDSSSNSEIYRYLYSVRDSIILNNPVEYKDKFPYRVRIIKDDKTLNAFCTPGGFIYFYTGILKFLENEAELAGVMGHEIAHAAKRHSTEALTRQYGMNIFTQLFIDTQYQVLSKIAGGLTQLSYGRKAELESDEYSVKWLYNTAYTAYGASGFFERIQSMGSGKNPEFLSTHPDPGKRVDHMKKLHQDLGGKPGNDFRERYQQNIKRYL
jgi:predicted Zn-dependent protease